MDFQELTDLVAAPCAVLSVERTSDNRCGAIRFVSANRSYRESLSGGFFSRAAEFRPGMLYHELVPPNTKFEDYCFRAAFLGQRMHAFTEASETDPWSDVLIQPMVRERDDLGYCQLLVERASPTAARGTDSVSVTTAEAVIKACMSLMDAQDFMESVNAVLQDILDVADAYRCRIQLLDRAQKTTRNFCEVHSNRAWPIPNPVDNVAEMPYELVSSWADEVGQDDILIVRDEADMAALATRNPAWVASMRSYGVSSIILSSLRQGDALFGFLYIVNYDVSKVDLLRDLLELMSFFLGSEISNHLLLQRLDALSRTDALTGLPNRNAMLQRLRDIDAAGCQRACGVVNLDLNGLKAVNDSEGHASGDRLLVRAAEALTKVFYREDVFRTGGDEFLIIAPDIDAAAFQRKLSRLRDTVLPNAGVSFAVGAHWTDGTEPLSAALRTADGRMYADKQTFYAGNPGLHRR